ncbi:MAG: DNA primase, partial [Paenibacillaceae bacterium]|nr:DNA primase [Paenibacillaceae bacterium]
MDKQALVQTIINTIDIVERVGRVVSLTRRGKSHVGLCPFHKEKTPSFHVIPEKRIFHCFGCGAGGTVVRFVMNVDGLSFGEAV